MTQEERQEYNDLINKWNSTDITPEQMRRLEQLESIDDNE